MGRGSTANGLGAAGLFRVRTPVMLREIVHTLWSKRVHSVKPIDTAALLSPRVGKYPDTGWGPVPYSSELSPREKNEFLNRNLVGVPGPLPGLGLLDVC